MTTSTAAVHLEVADNGIPLLDPEPHRFGPVTRVLLLRLVIGVGLVEAVGLYLSFGVATDRARAAGLSLIFPGGGFVYLVRPVAFVLTIAALILALILWWGLSAHFAIPVVWIGSAVAAALMVDAPRLVLDDGTTWSPALIVVPLLSIAFVATAAWRFERRFRAKRAQVPELNQYLSTVELPEVETTFRPPNAMDAELLRFCLDLAGQPADGLRGLDWGEQFHSGTQLRYQLNAYCWALSMFAANYVPNAPAQVTRSLEALVLKHTDLRVWGYWRTLNLLGNFDGNPDPIVRDNIMFSAFFGDVLNTFESATGSTRFDEPGSLTFTWKDGRTFAYDHHSIIDAVQANFERSKLGFFPCEPGWSFTVCNVMGAQSMYGHDTLHGTDRWEQHRDQWLRALEQEYLTPDGTYAHIRSNHIGLSWDTGEVPDGHYTANGTGRFADILPGHERRARALDLRKAVPAMEFLSSLVADDDLPMDLPAEPERHRTSESALQSWTRVIGGARLVGDDELLRAAVTGAERQCATGKRWPERPMATGSTGLGGHCIVRWSGPLALPDLNQRGYVAPVGPVLADTDWDGVLIVMARSEDGESLDLVLEPRHELSHDGSERVIPCTLSGLVPGRGYTLEPSGTVFVADAEGVATIDVEVAGRVALHIAATIGDES